MNKSQLHSDMNSLPKISDQNERQQALNPRQSYIVQAPAGSGKTELLIQRYLTLLASIDHAPEEIIALTFTRKAAIEMQSRIIDALQMAQKEPPGESHKVLTWKLARNALTQDKAKAWNILTNPKRLRITTLDAFCAYLTRQMPILAQFGAQPTISDNPLPLYQEAAQRIINSLDTHAPWIPALENTLLHLDNDYSKAEKLLIHMLGKREQWLPYLGMTLQGPEPRKRLELALQQIAIDALQQTYSQTPKSLISTILPLANFAALHVPAETPIAYCHSLKTLPEPKLTHLTLWRGIADLLLTKSYQWRKRPDKSIGFPSPSEAKDAHTKQLFKLMKEQMQALLTVCQEHTEWRKSLQDLCNLPPYTYQDSQWETINNLIQILKVTAGYLQVIFQEKNIVDYSEISMRAIQALGSALIPSDLALSLDQQITHILIDEFQDTSVLQVELLERLTDGWQTDDGKTLFIVGDPMQSIYRFRKAEVGLFLRAQRLGIGNISLIPLVLKANFRSQPTIIDWINNTFAKILPRDPDLLTGAVPFTSSVAMQISQPDAEIGFHATWDPASEGLQIAQLIQEKHHQGSIAILVRSKNHLAAIIPALRQAKIPYRAIEMSSLRQYPIIQDLLALTKALLHFEDKIAWLAILRAPWCGLTLIDLYQITNLSEDACIWENIVNSSKLSLTQDGRKRLEKFKNTIEQALSHRGRLPLALWIEETWIALGGPACLIQVHELEYVDAFFELLQSQQQAGTIKDFVALEHELDRLYATSDVPEQQAVNLMTIHKAKGLEFDTVILPSLHRSARQDEQSLLVWLERPRADEGADLLLASIKEISQNFDPIYNYLQQQEDKKERFEMGRLLYVAATRAKHKLHLFTCLTINKTDNAEPAPSSTTPINYQIKKPNPNSLLNLLWPLYSKNFIQQLIPYEDKYSPLNLSPPANFYRLASQWQAPIANNKLLLKKSSITTKALTLENDPSEFLIKKIFASIVRDGIATWKEKNLSYLHPHWSSILSHLGVPLSTIKPCIQKIEKAIFYTLQDNKAHWLLDPKHPNSQTNYPITAYLEKQYIQIVIDRTFYDKQGIRWIILYWLTELTEKNSHFYSEQLTSCSRILNLYGQAMNLLNDAPTRLCLYFPLQQHCIEWDYVPQSIIS